MTQLPTQNTRVEKSSVLTADGSGIWHRLDQVTSSPAMKSFLAGAASGTCSTVLFQPLDVIKTRLQKSAISGPKRGMMAEVVHVVQHNKIFGLWAGLVPSLLRCVPGIGLYFTSLHCLQSVFVHQAPSPAEAVLLAASARIVAGVTVLPFTVMKTRFESGDFQFTSLSQGLKSTYSKEGVRALYSGLVPTLLRDVPFSGIYFMFYTQLKKLTAGDGVTTASLNFTSGVISGCLASLLTQPADVIKTSMQLYPQQCRKLQHSLLLIYKQRGLAGFWWGMVPRLLRRTLVSAMSWTLYEEIMKAVTVTTS